MMIDRRTFIAAAAALPIATRASAQGRMLRNSIAVEDGRVWIAAKINDGEPRYFVIDTGANVSLIVDTLAKQLQFKPIGRSNLVGVGGLSDFPYYNGGSLTFASGLRIPQMLFAGTRAGLGKDAAGSLSAGLFTSYDSDLDFVKGEWRAYPAGRPDFAGLERVPSRFKGDPIRGSRIFADARVGDYAGEFLVDTGAPSAVVLDGQAAGRSGLWSDDRPYAPAQGSGIGKGRVPRRIVRAEAVTIGSVSLAKPLVAVSKPGTPAHEADGFLGLRVLEQLHLTTQVKSKSLWIARNGRAAAPERYGMSGLWFDREGDGIFIGDVGTGSPAAEAGLKVGDRVSGVIWEALLRFAAGAPGDILAFDVARGAGRSRRVELKLTPYL